MDNNTLTREQAVEYVRKAIDDRATWFYLLLKEAASAGLDEESLARKAIFQFGCLKGGRLEATDDMLEFMGQFASEVSKGVFDMDLREISSDRAVLEFNYCPLVECWRRLGCDGAETDRLCDWAMEGDHGIMSKFPAFEMDIQSRIGAGDKCCRLVFSKVKQDAGL